MPLGIFMKGDIGKWILFCFCFVFLYQNIWKGFYIEIISVFTST